MKRILLSTFMLASVSAIAQQASESVSKFAFDFYRNISKEKNTNIVFSPFSITPAFGMVTVGAKAETEKQIAQVFHFPLNSAFHSELGALQRKIQTDANSSVDLSITNRVFMEKSYKVSCSYQRALKKQYKAKAEKVDFINNPNPSRLKINSIIQSDTKNYIKELLPEESISNLTRLVLTNAIYFKGKWEVQFDPKKTTQRDFILSSGDKVNCATMFVDERMGYYQGGKYSAIELNYKGKNLSMLILLPNEKLSISDFEKDFSYDMYKKTLEALTEEKVTVLLPKFKIETSLSLKKMLTAMGMPIPFTDAADFSGISGNKDLKISDAFHKAFIEVSEEGTTAAAATAVVLARKSVMPQNEFIVNRPFIYILKHNSSNTILFMGKVENPNK